MDTLRTSLTKAFETRRLASTLSAIVALAGALTLTILKAYGRLSDTAALTAILAILSFIAFTEVLTRVLTLTRMEGALESLCQNITPSRSVLQRASALTPLEEFLKGSDDVLFIGLNKIGVFVHRINYFADLIKGGCSIRLLILDSEAERLFEYVCRNLEISASRMFTDIKQTVESIASINACLSPEQRTRLHVERFAGSPGLGLILVDGNKETGRMQIYFYAYQTDPPARPGLEITRSQDQAWFDFFRNRYEKLWLACVSAHRETDAANSEK